MNVLIPIATAMMLETYPMTIGGEAVRNERTLLARVEDGELMQSSESVRFLILHCSATRRNQDYSVEQLIRDHKKRGFRTIGYHFYIRKDGTITQHRKLLEVGAHCRPYNRCSIGICYEGGWMSMASHVILAPRHRLNVLSNCCISCISCFRKRRLWDITTCLALRRRLVLVWIPMPYSGG